FLRTSATVATMLASGCSTLPSSGARAQVGTQLFGWGQYYKRDGKNLDDHLDEVLSAVRDCGFDYAEHNLSISNPEAAVQFAELAKKKGLGVTCFYTGGALHELNTAREEVAKILAAAKAVKPFGSKVINCNPNPIGRAKTDEELQVQARALAVLGRDLNVI